MRGAIQVPSLGATDTIMVCFLLFIPDALMKLSASYAAPSDLAKLGRDLGNASEIHEHKRIVPCIEHFGNVSFCHLVHVHVMLTGWIPHTSFSILSKMYMEREKFLEG